MEGIFTVGLQPRPTQYAEKSPSAIEAAAAEAHDVSGARLAQPDARQREQPV